MIRRALAAVVAVLVTVLSAVAGAAPAHAYDSLPSELQYRKYYNGTICVGSTLSPSYYPVAVAAQSWNNAVSGDMIALDFSTSCAADGYSAMHSMTVGVFNNPNYNGCLYFTNTASFPYGDGSPMEYWQHGVGVYINIGIPGCVSTAQRRAHQIAAGIGWALGFDLLTSSGYASRVMCTCSTDTLRYPSSVEGTLAWNLYFGRYGGK
jgi:hypothetical protein